MVRFLYKRHRFPPDVIRHAVWLRFTLSIRDVEELLAERGIDISRESVRCWVIKFGPSIVANLPAPRTAQPPVAPRRDGREDQHPADVALVRSTTRARFWTCWSRSGATPMPP